MQQLVVFSLGAAEFGLPITQVQEVIRYSRPRTVPFAPPGRPGVINLRGRSIPVCDLRQRLGIGGPQRAASKIVIVESGPVLGGLVVDKIDGVLTVDPEQVVAAPAAAAPHVQGVANVGDRLIVVLNLASLFNDQSADVEVAA